MKIELKSCPFCDEPGSVVREGNRSQSTQYECEMCGASLETGEEWGIGHLWNKRPREEKLEKYINILEAIIYVSVVDTTHLPKKDLEVVEKIREKINFNDLHVSEPKDQENL